MSQVSFSAEWLHKFSDPFAVVGISVSADERRITRRYREIAKLLHPDCYVSGDETEQATAMQFLARLVNPAYQQLKQDKKRAEVLATLRFRVRRLTRDQTLLPQCPQALQLLKKSVAEAEVFYEQTVTELAAQQYGDFAQFESCTQALSELNLVYLQIKMGDPIIRQKRSGIMAAPQAKPVSVNGSASTNKTATHAEPSSLDYAQRHYQRAMEYAKKANWSMAVQELRDAIRINPKRSEYHALLGMAYLKQNLPGMATVHIRQALKLNPQDSLARRYAAQLKIQATTSSQEQPQRERGGLFGNLFARKS